MHEKMLAAVVMRMPVHGGGVAVHQLLPVHADITVARFRIARENLAKGDEAPGVLRPALDDRQLRKIDLRAGQYDVLTRAGAHGFGWDGSQLGQHRHHLYFAEASVSDIRLD